MSGDRLTPHQARVLELMRGGQVLRHIECGGAETLGLFAPGQLTTGKPFVRRSTAQRLVELGFVTCCDRTTGEPGAMARILYARREWRPVQPDAQESAA